MSHVARQTINAKENEELDIKKCRKSYLKTIINFKKKV